MKRFISFLIVSLFFFSCQTKIKQSTNQDLSPVTIQSSDKPQIGQTALQTDQEMQKEAWWTKSTERGDLSLEKMSGQIRGRAFVLESAIVRKRGNAYFWTFSNQLPQSPCGLISNDDAVNFTSEVLHVGTFYKALDQDIRFANYHASYEYTQETGESLTVQPDWALKLVVNKVDYKNKKIKGWARFVFADQTSVEGLYKADYCE